MIQFGDVFRSLKKSPFPGKLLVALILKRTGLCRFVTIRHPDFNLRFHPTSLSLIMHLDVHCRREDHDFLHAYLRPGDTVFDVGANIGALSLTSSLCVGERGKVFSFEPHPRIFKFLLDNFSLNGRSNLSAFNTALGDKEGTLRFTDIASDDMNSVVLDGAGLEVPVRRLDDFLHLADKIDLIKIDVEGYEKWVLAGARQTLRRTSCVYFESYEPNFMKYGYHCEEVFGLFRDEGFDILRPVPGGVSRIPADYRSPGLENLIATRDVGAYLDRMTGTRLISSAD